jgi:AI-2 transport protein TqsA
LTKQSYQIQLVKKYPYNNREVRVMEKTTAQSPAARILITAACFVIVIAGMRAAESIIVPFLLSAFIAVICSSPLFWLKQKGIPTGIAVLIVLAGIMVIALVIVVLVGTSLQDFSNALPTYQEQLREELAGLLTWLQGMGVKISSQELLKYVDPGAAMQLFAGTLNGFRKVLTNAFLIMITVIFILLEVSGFSDKLRAALGDAESSFAGLGKITDGIKRYMAIKTLTSLATGIFVGIWLAVIGLDYPVLWGLVAFLLNYVPNIGSIIAAIPALLLAFIQLGPGHVLLAMMGYGVANAVIGTVVEPRVMGHGVGLSTLVVFLSLVFWGWVLGPVGMFLSVLLTMILKIALEHNEDTRWIALLLGSKASADAVLPDLQNAPSNKSDESESSSSRKTNDVH